MSSVRGNDGLETITKVHRVGFSFQKSSSFQTEYKFIWWWPKKLFLLSCENGTKFNDMFYRKWFYSFCQLSRRKQIRYEWIYTCTNTNIFFFVISDPIPDRQIVLAALDIKYTTLNDTVRKLNIQTLIWTIHLVSKPLELDQDTNNIHIFSPLISFNRRISCFLSLKVKKGSNQDTNNIHIFSSLNYSYIFIPNFIQR